MTAPPSYLKISYINHIQHEEHTPLLPFADSKLHQADIINVKTLTEGEDVKKVYDLSINLEGIVHKFKPGDTIGILPNNDEDEIDMLLDRLNLLDKATQNYHLTILENTTKKKPTIPNHIPIYGTLRNIFTRNLNLRSVPKKVFIRSLSKYTEDAKELEKINKLCDPKENDYETFILNDGRSLLGILNAFPQCHPTIECLLEHLPNLQPRYYSIASSPSINNLLHIVFSVIDNNGLKGVCSNWLEKQCLNLSKANKIAFYFRKSSKFLLLDNPKTPIIMIGPGTGVAPFIGLLQDRFMNKSIDYGDSTLFFGCRNDNDYLFKDKIDMFMDFDVLNHFFVAFSRINEHKIYVQNKMYENGQIIVDKILKQGAYFCVCGDAKNMEKDVEKMLIKCFISFANLSETEALNYIIELKKSNKYQTDIWI